jgi:hypothetical protein
LLVEVRVPHLWRRIMQEHCGVGLSLIWDADIRTLQQENIRAITATGLSSREIHP